MKWFTKWEGGSKMSKNLSTWFMDDPSSFWHFGVDLFRSLALFRKLFCLTFPLDLFFSNFLVFQWLTNNDVVLKWFSSIFPGRRRRVLTSPEPASPSRVAWPGIIKILTIFMIEVVSWIVCVRMYYWADLNIGAKNQSVMITKFIKTCKTGTS